MARASLRRRRASLRLMVRAPRAGSAIQMRIIYPCYVHPSSPPPPFLGPPAGLASVPLVGCERVQSHFLLPAHSMVPLLSIQSSCRDLDIAKKLPLLAPRYTATGTLRAQTPGGAHYEVPTSSRSKFFAFPLRHWVPGACTGLCTTVVAVQRNHGFWELLGYAGLDVSTVNYTKHMLRRLCAAWFALPLLNAAHRSFAPLRHAAAAGSLPMPPTPHAGYALAGKTCSAPLQRFLGSTRALGTLLATTGPRLSLCVIRWHL
ncbi:hypothetical protein C8R43DRAFT_1126287 [Mycena crocata]|nr:hypothetical protein C8R43DRAFT_1126287 [Mycena crocata]